MQPPQLIVLAIALLCLIVTPVQSRESGANSEAVRSVREDASLSSGFAGDRPSLARRDYGRHHRLVSIRGQIQHVVIIYMENRTPDDLFAGYARTPFPPGGTVGTALDVRDPLAKPTLAPNALGAHFDPNHYHAKGFVDEAAGDYGAVDLGCTPGQCPPHASVFSYVPAPEPSPYLALISNFAYADHVLQSNAGPSFPAHQYAIAGQSGGLRDGFVSPFSIAPFSDSENPAPVTGPRVASGGDDELPTKGVPLGNCFSGKSYVEKTLDMDDPYPARDGDLHPPCIEFRTILDEAADVLGPPVLADWQYIASRNDSIWAAPMSVQHLYQSFVDDPLKADEPFAVDPDALNFVDDLSAARPSRPFAALTYITPCIHESDHPNNSGMADGPAWLAYTVNAIGRSRYWPQTTIIVTWDDWGGFYDHFRTGSAWPFHPFPNPYDNPQDPNEWGFRVPLIVVSPYVRSRGYVSTGVRSQGAILNYVERTLGLPSLDGDDRTNGSDDLGDMFDFAHAPLPYVPVTGGKQFDPTRLDCADG